MSMIKWKILWLAMISLLFICISYSSVFGTISVMPSIYEVNGSTNTHSSNPGYSVLSFDPDKNESCDITATIRKLDLWPPDGWGTPQPLPQGFDILHYYWEISIIETVSPYNTYKTWFGDGVSVTTTPTTFASLNWDGKDDNGQSVPEGDYILSIDVYASYTEDVYYWISTSAGWQQTVTVKYEEPGIEIVYLGTKVPLSDQNATPVPLGLNQTFDVIDKNTKDLINAKWSFSSNGMAPFGLLFPTQIAFLYDENTKSSNKQLQAVHIGSGKLKATITINGKDYDDEKEIEVKPYSLGNGHNTIQIQYPKGTFVTYNLDQKLNDWANEFGIPPQILKAQVHQESSFNNRAFRYEPGYDYQLISKLRDKRNVNPYKYYRVATVDGLSQGTKLQQEDIDIRNESLRVVDINNDTYVSAQELIDKNSGQNWPSVREDFTAQTTIASSYGLLQAMFPTAVLMGWRDAFGNLGDRPSKLFDPDTILPVGARYLANQFRSSGLYLNYSQWESDWKRAIKQYNPFKVGYATDVWDKVPLYLPPIISPPNPAPARQRTQRGSLIAKSGGLIFSINNIKTRLVIPPNALPEDAKVLIIKKSMSDNQGISFDLVAVSNKNGQIITKLNSPATIILYYNIENNGYITNTNVLAKEADNRLGIFYNDLIDWQRIQNHVDTNQQTVTAQITNLGSYALMPTLKAAGISLNKVVPNPFTPNGDGINDEVYFYYDNPDNESISIKIFDLSGSLAKELEAIDGVAPLWDGKNSDGKIMEGGVYIYRMKIDGKVKSGTIILAK